MPYVDPYSTVKSIKALREGITGYGSGIFTKTQCETYFATAQRETERAASESEHILPAYQSPLYAGLWLLYEPETVYEALYDGACRAGSNKFWERIYQITKDRKGFEVRNQRYLASLKREELKQNYEPWKDVEIEQKHNITERTDPDDFIEWEGLISPNGEFYSCGFGSHSVKAQSLINANWKYWKEVLTEEEQRQTRKFDLAEDILIKHGWAATRYSYEYGDHIACPMHLTSLQRETIEQNNSRHGRNPVEIPAFGFAHIAQKNNII